MNFLKQEVEPFTDRLLAARHLRKGFKVTGQSYQLLGHVAALHNHRHFLQQPFFADLAPFEQRRHTLPQP